MAAAAITKLASTSACCWARAPASVMGLVAPNVGQGSELNGVPDSTTPADEAYAAFGKPVPGPAPDIF